jgi:glyoxylase-like metal-dependent hydrolase (beta-lactamase superfamily II)
MVLDDEGPTGASYALPPERIKFIPDSALSQIIGPFPHAMDFFGDGSVYVVDAAGHAPGHINLLARTSADGAWICLAGDSAHDPRVIRGEKNIPVKTLEEGVFKGAGIYLDLEKTMEHIERLRALHKTERVHVLIPHDYEWYESNQGGGAFFPGTIPPCV